MVDINSIISRFAFDGAVRSVREFGSGHINQTYLADCGQKQYVIQQINTAVFKDVDALMHNVFAVTEFLTDYLKEHGLDSERGTLHFVRTRDGQPYCRTEDSRCYRAYEFVKDSVSYDTADAALFKRSGAAFGRFQQQLSGFPAEKLAETIPHFHDSAWRYENEFLPALANGDAKRREIGKAEIAFVRQHKGLFNVLAPYLASGDIPLRVTHNDTKLNNVLFDSKTDECICVIDLDTVMPGLALFDFGDSIRYGAASAAEDEAQLNKVTLKLDYFKAYAEGFLGEAGDTLTACERRFLPHGALQMTLECGMRFLTDYLNGDTYFKTDYPAHNLDRAKNQFALLDDMLSKQDEMLRIIDSL